MNQTLFLLSSVMHEAIEFDIYHTRPTIICHNCRPLRIFKKWIMQYLFWGVSKSNINMRTTKTIMNSSVKWSPAFTRSITIFRCKKKFDEFSDYKNLRIQQVCWFWNMQMFCGQLN
jgi:hypothetical protein